MKKIAVLGLGYVGLPLAVAFGKKRPTVGFDIKKDRVDELKKGIDSTLEVEADELKSSENLLVTDSPEDLADSQIYIVTVPTPINENKTPDLRPIEGATRMLASVLKKGDIVIYESTVYPGCTEEFCVPILEEMTGLKYNIDFFAGYSPERMNPGDKEHTLAKITKVTSGSNPEIAKEVDDLYNEVVEVGTYLASSIRVAEAAKVIENAQRDINIAFVNELAIIFNRIGIDTMEVLKAAGTKWNFLKFRPGLVGGHCIGVDPYYLTHKAQEVGYHPEVILAGRRINDDMGKHVAGQMIKTLIKKGKNISGARVLVLGLTFKENCPDVRNTKVVDVVSELADYGLRVDVCDPWVNPTEVKKYYGLEVRDFSRVAEDLNYYDGIVFAVAHHKFQELDIDGFKGLIFDVKSMLEPKENILRL